MKSSIALVSLHEGYDLKMFVKSFSRFLNRTQTCQVLSSKTIFPRNYRIAQAEPNSIFERSLMQVIERFQNEKDMIIYLADNDLSNWSKRSLNEADEVWLIGQYENEMELTPIAKKLMYQKANEKTSLVVEFGNKEIEQEEASHWLVPKNINHFYSITKNNFTDLERLVNLFINNNQTTSLTKAA